MDDYERKVEMKGMCVLFLETIIAKGSRVP